MNIIVTKCKGKDLLPGNLFSSVGPEYWGPVMKHGSSIGERVYIRTNTPCPKDQENEEIFKIEIER